jgi:putative SOS response-associated peptidase YedK
MCGKFTQRIEWQNHPDLNGLLLTMTGERETVTPMRFASVLMRGDGGERQMKRMRWGFAKASADAPGGTLGKRGPDHIHARAETIDSKPTFAEAFQNRRGLLLVETFNEGKEITPRKTQQHTITPRDNKPIAIAVLWERWTHPTQPELLTFVMATTPPNELIATITDRMPAIVQPQNWSKWLGEQPATPQELKGMLTPFEGDWTMAPEKSVARPGADLFG